MKEILNEAALFVLLNTQMSYPLFKGDKTSLSVIELPFFEEYVLVKAKTFSTIPVVEFSFLWDERCSKVIKIDGTRDCFFDNVELLKPQITVDTAVAYIKFVLGNVWDENGAIKVCESIDDVEFSSSPFPNQISFLCDNIAPAEVVEGEDKIVVRCSVVYGTALHRAEIELLRNGLFEIVDEQQIGDEIPAIRTIFLE